MEGFPMMRWLSWIPVSAVLLGGVQTTYAQVIPQLEINLYATGNAHTKSKYEIGFPQSLTPIPSEFHFDDALGGGIRFNVHKSGHWAEEFFYSFEANDANFIRKTTPTTFQTKTELGVQIHNLGVNGLFYFNDDDAARTRPFLSFGLGATIYRPTAETRAFVRDPRNNLRGFNQSNEFAFNYGIGFKQRIGSIYGVRMDVRHFMGRNPSFSLARSSADPTATVFPADGAIHSFEASAGIVFFFSK
jgi:hypothetical protein